MAAVSSPQRSALQPYALPAINEPKSLEALIDQSLPDVSEDGCTDTSTDACFSDVEADYELPADKEEDTLDFDDTRHKGKGMTSSREPNERYDGGSKDSLFGERYGNALLGMRGSGGDDGEDERNTGFGGGSGGGGCGGGGGSGGGGGGGRRSQGSPMSNSGHGSADSQRMTNGADLLRVPVEKNSTGYVQVQQRVNRKGQTVAVHNHGVRRFPDSPWGPGPIGNHESGST